MNKRTYERNKKKKNKKYEKKYINYSFKFKTNAQASLTQPLRITHYLQTTHKGRKETIERKKRKKKQNTQNTIQNEFGGK